MVGRVALRVDARVCMWASGVHEYVDVFFSLFLYISVIGSSRKVALFAPVR